MSQEAIKPITIHRESATLYEYKQVKFLEIKLKTDLIILSTGFIYNGKTFSLEDSQQLNILGAERRKDVQAILPLEFNTIDDMDTEILETAAEVDNFFDAALLSKKTILDSATALKSQVRAATTKDEVDLVIDNR